MTNIKQAGKQVIAHLYYENYMKRVRRNWPLVDVCSVNQTISMLQNTDHSLVRFGDGELTFIRGRNLQLQNSNRELQKRLADILGYSHDGLVVSVQDIFNGLNSFVPAWSMRTLCSPAVILREQINPSAGNGFHRSGKSGKERML